MGWGGSGGVWVLVGGVWLVLVAPARWRLRRLGSSGRFGVVGRSAGSVVGGGRGVLDYVPAPLTCFVSLMCEPGS